MKPANATVQDDIPPVHVLEAAQSQDRKETEDLLAGFDRPGRSPKPASKERDFVDYYARKKPGSADSGGGRAAAPANAAVDVKLARQADLSTVIVHRKSEGMPAWLGWAAAALGMLVVGGAVAYLATSDARPSAVEPTAPSAATTITSASAPPQAQANADTNIPPPAPAEATTATATGVTVVEPVPSSPLTARSATKRDGRAVPSATTTTATGAATAPRATNATDDTKPPPRDDFIRDL